MLVHKKHTVSSLLSLITRKFNHNWIQKRTVLRTPPEGWKNVRLNSFFFLWLTALILLFLILNKLYYFLFFSKNWSLLIRLCFFPFNLWTFLTSKLTKIIKFTLITQKIKYIHYKKICIQVIFVLIVLHNLFKCMNNTLHTLNA